VEDLDAPSDVPEEPEAQSDESLVQVEVASPDADTLVVTLTGELDLSNVERIETDIAPQLESGRQRMIVEARDLEFADSSAIALWLRWSSQVEHFELRNLSPLLRRVLTAMGLEQRLEFGT